MKTRGPKNTTAIMMLTIAAAVALGVVVGRVTDRDGAARPTETVANDGSLSVSLAEFAEWDADLEPCCPVEPGEARVGESTGIPADSVYHVAANWTDHRGDRLELATLRGRPVIMTMIYAACIGTCPVLMVDVRRLYDSLPADVRDDVVVIAASFDHENDTPEVLAEYAHFRRYNRPGWHFLHGDRAAVRELATVLGIRYSHRADGVIAHTDRIVVLDREGRIIANVDGIMQPVEAAADALIAAAR